ncbi:GAF domain-containing protein [Streptomyces sp. NPDC010273]|uniref:GAF domain-containing protein n=1 Tax=Streptomyces sp. NPDC010273 TaxID=3364829 RepID=UPI0036EF5D91
MLHTSPTTPNLPDPQHGPGPGSRRWRSRVGGAQAADKAQGHALVLEEHSGLDSVYRDESALVSGPPYVCARAQRLGEPVTVPDVATDPDLRLHPVGRALLSVGSHALVGVPLITPDGRCAGVLTLHWSNSGIWLTDEQRHSLGALAAEAVAWRSWYRRTVVLNALEYLHQHREAQRDSRKPKTDPLREEKRAEKKGVGGAGTAMVPSHHHPRTTRPKKTRRASEAGLPGGVPPRSHAWDKGDGTLG